MFWKRALPAVVLVAVMLFAAPTDAQQGERANVTEVSEEVRGENEGPVGPWLACRARIKRKMGVSSIRWTPST